MTSGRGRGTIPASAVVLLAAVCLWWSPGAAALTMTPSATIPDSVTPTPTPTPAGACDPLAPACPLGTACDCCCGAWLCLPPGTVCCLLPCALPTPPPTATATATPTPPAPACTGDCDGGGAVSIDELVLGVTIVLGNAPAAACPSLQCVPGSEGVFVNCLVRAVNNALFGCGGASPTPTPCAVGQCVSTLGAGCTGRACEPGGPECGLNELCDLSGRQCPCAPPTPVLPHGHTCCECEDAACRDFAWVEVVPACPQGCRTFPEARCEAPCHGGPQSGPAICVPITPCTSDQECDDGNGCTVDECTFEGCTHHCLCL